MISEQYKYSEITSKIIGCAMIVHKILANGFQEVIYIGTRRVGFLIENIISVELKAITKLENLHFVQAINYPEAYDPEIGLLINFGEQNLIFKRLKNKKFNHINSPSA